MLLAKPWWVNLLILVPLISLYCWRRKRLDIGWKALFFAAAFAAAFGFVEAACVDYLRGNVPAVQQSSFEAAVLANSEAVRVLPDPLLKTETTREAATMVMLLAVPLLGATKARERWALFLWCFAIWDVVYYLGLWATIHWPNSLSDVDVLFLIPKPWYSEVWYPILVSGASIAAVAIGSSGLIPKSRPVRGTARGVLPPDFSAQVQDTNGA